MSHTFATLIFIVRKLVKGITLLNIQLLFLRLKYKVFVYVHNIHEICKAPSVTPYTQHAVLNDLSIF